MQRNHIAQLNDEEALDQLQDYPAYDQDYYRTLRDWFRMSPRRALRYFLRERAYETKRDEEKEEA